MTDDYTPTTSEVCDYYVEGRLSKHDGFEVAQDRQFFRWLAAHDAEVRKGEREKVAREIEGLRGSIQQWLEAYETHDATVWAEGAQEGAADLIERIARIARGGGS